MRKLIKVTPMFNRIITTMDTYEEDQYNGNLLDTTKQKGSLKEYQKVLSVGTTVRDIKEGDIVCIDTTRYMITRQKERGVMLITIYSILHIRGELSSVTKNNF